MTSSWFRCPTKKAPNLCIAGLLCDESVRTADSHRRGQAMQSELSWQFVVMSLNDQHAIFHYDDVIMSEIASQITSLTIVYSTVLSGADQSKHQSSASLAFVWEIHRWPVNFPHKWPVTRKIFPFDDVIMPISLSCCLEWVNIHFFTDKFTPFNGYQDATICYGMIVLSYSATGANLFVPGSSQKLLCKRYTDNHFYFQVKTYEFRGNIVKNILLMRLTCNW